MLLCCVVGYSCTGRVVATASHFWTQPRTSHDLPHHHPTCVLANQGVGRAIGESEIKNVNGVMLNDLRVIAMYGQVVEVRVHPNVSTNW